MNPLYRLINFIAPDSCMVCATEGTMLCESCREAELTPLISCCFRCGKVTRAFSTCSGCRKTTKLDSVHAVAKYEGFAKELVQQTKFSHYRGGVDVMASAITEVVPLSELEVIVHSPTSSDRVRERGFDQAKAIAKQVARKSSLPYADCISRVDNSHQVGKSRAERIKHAEGAYRIKSANLIDGKSVLIIDDVYTTGATLMAIAKLLRKAGAKRVSAAVFAH